MDTWISLGLAVLFSMLMVSSMLDVSSNSGPSTDDVLFSEDFSLPIRLEPKMASRSTFEALSSGTTSGPKVRPDLRCMYDYEVQVMLEFCCQQVQVATVKIHSSGAGNYCSTLKILGLSFTLTDQCNYALVK